MSARSKIVDALVTKLKLINGTGIFESNTFGNVFNKLKFWDEINDHPSIYLNAGPESREYLPGASDFYMLPRFAKPGTNSDWYAGRLYRLRWIGIYHCIRSG